MSTVTVEADVVNETQPPPPSAPDLGFSTPPASGGSQHQSSPSFVPPIASGGIVGTRVDGATASVTTDKDDGNTEDIPSLGEDTGIPFPQIHGDYTKGNFKFSMKRRNVRQYDKVLKILCLIMDTVGDGDCHFPLTLMHRGLALKLMNS